MPIPLHWHTEPFLLISLLLAGWVYAAGTGPLRGRLAPAGTVYPAGRAAAFYGGLAIIYLAVGSPLDQIGEDYLFTAHMVQHMLLVYAAPPLLLWGTPWWLADAVLARPRVRRLVAPFVHPAVCAVSFLLVFTLWHLPPLYEEALHRRWIHVLEHATIFLTALQMWWVFLSPSRALPPCGPLARLAVAFFIVIGHMPIMGLLTVSPDPLYPTYELAPRIIRDFDARQDQILGGVVMELVAVLVSLVLAAWSFRLWAREEAARPDARRAAAAAAAHRPHSGVAHAADSSRKHPPA